MRNGANLSINLKHQNRKQSVHTHSTMNLETWDNRKDRNLIGSDQCTIVANKRTAKRLSRVENTLTLYFNRQFHIVEAATAFNGLLETVEIEAG